jgi:hypothetical protein
MVGFDSGHHTVSVRKRGKPIPRRRLKPRRGPVVDLNYQKFIRNFACVACMGGLVTPDEAPVDDADRQKSRTEFAHVSSRGLGQLCDDLGGLPLCGDEHHRNGPHSHHKLGRRFWAFHDLDRQALILEAQGRYIAAGGVFKSA